MTSQPVITWSIIAGAGAINSSGLFSAPAVGTVATVRATSGSISSTTIVNVVDQSPLLANSGVPSVPSNAFVGATVPLSGCSVRTIAANRI